MEKEIPPLKTHYLGNNTLIVSNLKQISKDQLTEQDLKNQKYEMWRKKILQQEKTKMFLESNSFIL